MPCGGWASTRRQTTKTVSCFVAELWWVPLLQEANWSDDNHVQLSFVRQRINGRSTRESAEFAATRTASDGLDRTKLGGNWCATLPLGCTRPAEWLTWSFNWWRTTWAPSSSVSVRGIASTKSVKTIWFWVDLELILNFIRNWRMLHSAYG